MRVLIYEHLCGGGMQGEPLPRELANAGAGMLQAVVEDFVIAGCDVATTLDARVDLSLAGAHVTPVASNDVGTVVETLAKEADATLIIAPEFDGILHQWAKRLASWNVVSLGSSADAIALCSDKLRTFERLSSCHIRTPPTYRGSVQDLIKSNVLDVTTADGQFVTKPRDGAGCEETFVVGHESTAAFFGRPSHRQRELITQPRIVGQPISVSFIVTRTHTHPLLIGDQHITGRSTLRYEGGTIPTSLTDTTPIFAVSRQTIDAIDGLHGFVGMDLIVEERTGQPWVIDINPRLTVSYSALRKGSKVNLAKAMLGQAVPDRWHSDVVTFDAAGHTLEATV